MIRGIRNNNPGNIEERPGDLTHWVGERATDDDPRFEEFDFMWQGVRAAKKVFQNYGSKYGLNTVEGLITRWAPPDENNTKRYIRAVCDRAGVDPTTEVNLHDMTFMHSFLRGVFFEENGPLADTLVTDNDMHLGLMAA